MGAAMTRTVELEATYRIVTPCFSGGANHDAELRLPSFKGVLRFWWRAWAWAHYNRDLEIIKGREDKLFGGPATGQSRVLLSLVNGAQPRILPKDAILPAPGRRGTVGEGARYLGYGVMHAADARSGVKAGQLQRACLLAPHDFTVHLRCRSVDDEMLESVTAALTALGLLGGIGARSRKGYGSLCLQSLRVDGQERWSQPQSVQDLCGKVENLRVSRDLRDDLALPEYTALSGAGRHLLLSGGNIEAMDLLDLIGAELVMFRSSGRNGQVLGGRAAAESRFKDDHLMLVTGRPPRSHPRRIAFGLPLNFGSQQVRPHGRLDRRASPLFIHLHECAGQPVAVVSFLPARFLPQRESGVNATISVGGRPVPQQPEEELYQPVRDFLDRLLDDTERQRRFTQVLEVGS
jgi:CRISPR-associated protein Cmr1